MNKIYRNYRIENLEFKVFICVNLVKIDPLTVKLYYYNEVFLRFNKVSI